MPRGVRKSSEKRRRSILDASLLYFAEVGYGAATIEQIRARCGASVGSIYHHFGSKEQIAAALYVEGLKDYHAGLLARLHRQRDSQRGVQAIVTFHLDWIERYQEWARFLLTMRHAEFMAEAEPEIRTMNQEFFAAVRQWFHEQDGALRARALPIDVYAAVLIGPAQEFARHWLAGRTHTPLPVARRLLAEAACRAVAGWRVADRRGARR